MIINPIVNYPHFTVDGVEYEYKITIETVLRLCANYENQKSFAEIIGDIMSSNGYKLFRGLIFEICRGQNHRFYMDDLSYDILLPLKETLMEVVELSFPSNEEIDEDTSDTGDISQETKKDLANDFNSWFYFGMSVLHLNKQEILKETPRFMGGLTNFHSKIHKAADDSPKESPKEVKKTVSANDIESLLG